MLITPITGKPNRMYARFLPAGDRALLVEFDLPIEAATNARIAALERWLESDGPAGIVETVPAFRSLLVYYDPRAVAYDDLCAALRAGLALIEGVEPPPARLIELPCCYDDPALGFDLAAAAERLQLQPAELVRLHSSVDYLVYFIGFAPGQPYLTGLPEQLAIPRLETPRTRTPVGSVGIGGSQACVYSVESPGGFWILGHTPVALFDPTSEQPVLLRAGDHVRFRPVARAEYDRITADVHAGRYRVRIR